jgi:hypothetical protein
MRAEKVKQTEKLLLFMELMKTSKYVSPLFAVTIKTFTLKAKLAVNRFFLPIFAQPQKITGSLGETFPLIFLQAGF